MLKKDLRKKYLEKRMSLSKKETLFLSEKIFENIILQFKLSENQNVHVFLPITKFKEIDTLPFIKYLWSKKINVYVPKIFEGKMISLKFTESTVLNINHWGIKEPISNQNEQCIFDYVITPLLYCDKNGNRIGYGKGYYDQFFREINSNAKKIGVNYFLPEETIEDVFEKDVQLDYLAVPDEMLSFFGTSIFTK